MPAPRFGHTFTMVSSTKAVLFGGAISVSGTAGPIQASSSSPTKPTSTTSKPPAGLGNFKHDFVPSELAAHAAVTVSDIQMIIYGGAASGNQGLLKD